MEQEDWVDKFFLQVWHEQIQHCLGQRGREWKEPQGALVQKGLLAGQHHSAAAAVFQHSCCKYDSVEIYIAAIIAPLEITEPKMFSLWLIHLSHLPWLCKFISFVGV